MAKNKGNQKSDQSKAWMEETLLKLMETETYEEISIQEITDLAGLSRRTFYRNYTSKDEIIQDIFQKIWKEYESEIIRQSDLSLPNVVKILFDTLETHLDFLVLLNQHRLIPLCFAKVNELLPPTFNVVKGSSLSLNQESISYALSFSIGGFMRIIIRWLNESHEKSPEELSCIMKDIISVFNYSGNVTQ